MNLLKKITFLNIFLLIPLLAVAQEYSASGFIFNKENQPLEGAEVVFYKRENIQGHAISDKTGYWTTKLPNGDDYTVKIFYIGNTIFENIINLQKDTDFGIIKAEDSQSLEAVEVLGKKKNFETKIDRTIFNVENSVRAQGTDGFELLKGTPNVSVQGSNISIVGKNTVMVMIDNRQINLTGEDLANYLRSINSENIKSIEVITTPPAQYMADGNSGIINIILKKAPADSWAVTIRNSYLQNSYSTFAQGIGFTYNKKKVSLLLDFVKQEGANKTTETTDTFFEEDTWLSLTKRKDFMDLFRGIASLNYAVTDKANIGAKFIGLYNKPDIKDRNTTNIFDNNTGNRVAYILTDGFNNSKTENTNLNLFYTQKLDTLGKLMTLDLDYFRYNDLQNRDFESQDFNDENIPGNGYFAGTNISDQSLSNYSLKLDFNIPATWATINFGGRLSWIENSSDIKFLNNTTGIPTIDPGQTNIFDYNENTQALYFSFQRSLGKRWQSQFGLRYENTQTNSTTTAIDTEQNQQNKFNYDQVFPSAYLMYTPNENNNLSLSYSKRIGRPDYWSLNPFRWYFSPFAILEGNPFLQPSFTDNIELAHTIKEHLTFKLYHSHTRNGSFQIPFILDETNPPTTLFVRENFFKQNRYGLTITYSFYKWDWLESTNTINGYYNESIFTQDIPADPQNGFTYSIYSNNSFTLNHKRNLFAECNFNYNAPSYSLFNKITATSRLDIGFRYSLRDKGWNFGLYGTDIFRGYWAYASSVLNNTPQTRSIYFDERAMRISISYKFGNRKLGLGLRESGNEEEQERVR